MLSDPPQRPFDNSEVSFGLFDARTERARLGSV